MYFDQFSEFIRTGEDWYQIKEKKGALKVRGELKGLRAKGNYVSFIADDTYNELELNN